MIVDTKLYNIVDKEEDKEQLQNDINVLNKWSEDWQMNFNVNKCKVMNFGYNNKKMTYNIAGEELESTDNEKDLGVTLSTNLKPAEHITIRNCAEWCQCQYGT